MNISWGYSPKIEKYIPLGDYPADKYLIVARQAVENLGWSLSHISSNGLIVYTPLSLQSYSEEFSIKIEGNFAVVKSECIGIQMWFNDYGKNALNLEKFFHELAYVEYHLKDVWEESLSKFHQFVDTQDPNYFEKAPLTVKNKMKNILYLFAPQKGYVATPVLIWMNVAYHIFLLFLGVIMLKYLYKDYSLEAVDRFAAHIGVNSRALVLNGDYWRLFSYQFIHGGWSHLFFNMYALIYIGLMVEHKLKPQKFLFIYILSGAVGGLVSIVFHEEGFMVGASGAIMGLFGAFLALLLNQAFEKNATKALTLSTVLVVALMLFNGSISHRTDNSAHIGGFIAGFVLGYILIKDKINGKYLAVSLRYAISIVFTFVFAAFILAFTPNFQTKEFEELQSQYQENAYNFGRVYNIPSNLTKQAKLKFIKTQAIDAWKKNTQLVKKMQGLTLNKRQRFKVNFDSKIVEKASKISQLLYLECKEDNASYRKEIIELTYDINMIKLEAGRNQPLK